VVETNALFSRNRVQPVVAGALPEAVNLITKRHADNARTILKAVMTKDKELAFWVFTQDPLNAKLSIDEAVALFDEMYENTKAFLPF